MDIITIEDNGAITDIKGGNVKEHIKKYKPIITSKYISIYEYTRLLTELSLLLFNKKSLSKYINTIEVKNIIDTNKIAYELLKHGVFDAVIEVYEWGDNKSYIFLGLKNGKWQAFNQYGKKISLPASKVKLYTSLKPEKQPMHYMETKEKGSIHRYGQPEISVVIIY